MKFFNQYRRYHLMEAATGTGGGTGTGTATPPATDPAKQVEELRSMNTKLLERLDALEKKATAAPPEDDLAQKAKLKRDEDDQRANREKLVESALKFDLQSKEWLKSNASLLPKTIQGIFDQAEKETFASAVEKDKEIKVGIISEFFALKENMDLLTASQKISLDEFKKLTKTDKQDKAQGIYDSIFEPTFETLKKVKRAEQVAKGFADQSTGDQAYKERRLKEARKQHLGEKN